jgi:glycosyltransferase involved in cell wall biosynthesis
MTKYVINGIFLTQKLTGIQRYAFEIVKELDKLSDNLNIDLAVPIDTEKIPLLNNIRIVKTGSLKGILWEQISYLLYLRRHHATGICLMNIVPILKPNALATIHDISYRVNPRFFKSLRLRLSRYWHCVHYYLICKYAKHIFTDSEFTNSEIVKYYHVNPANITVAYCAWQHFISNDIDDSVINKFNLEKNSYFFSMSTIAKNKNLKWVIETAKNNQAHIFVIAGDLDFNRYAETIDTSAENIRFIGRISDDEAKALMKNCKAFLFPSFYEGFGLPPLEALAVGAPIVVSNTSCLPEIYGKAAHYINPTDYEVDLERLLEEDVEEPAKLLERYSWTETAKKVLVYIK